jgi:hypothetical protein
MHLRRTLQQPVPAPPVTGKPFPIHTTTALAAPVFIRTRLLQDGHVRLIDVLT